VKEGKEVLSSDSERLDLDLKKKKKEGKKERV